MKKLYYEIPTVEVFDVKVEGGFQLSLKGRAGGFEVDEWEMDEVVEEEL